MSAPDFAIRWNQILPIRFVNGSLYKGHLTLTFDIVLENMILMGLQVITLILHNFFTNQFDIIYNFFWNQGMICLGVIYLEVPTVVEIISNWLLSIILLTRTGRLVKAYSDIVSHWWPQASFLNIQSLLRFTIIE